MCPSWCFEATAVTVAHRGVSDDKKAAAGRLRAPTLRCLAPFHGIISNSSGHGGAQGRERRSEGAMKQQWMPLVADR